MNVLFQPFDSLHYLMNLRLDASGALQSDKLGDDYYLVLRVPYEQDLGAITPMIFRNVLLGAADRLCNPFNAFMKVGESAELGLFSKATVMTGFPILGVQNAASTYAMFVCNITLMPGSTDRLLTVYCSPNGLFAASNFCKVPAVIKYTMRQDKVVKHRKEKLTGYYVVDFIGSVELDRGSIWYNIPGSKIDYPVNAAMLHQKRIYIKSDLLPVFHSSGGVRIEPA